MTDSASIPVWRRIVTYIARVVVGVTFVISGFAKCIDPVGFILKIEDYFSAWGISGIQVLEVTAAFGLSILEFVLGAMLLLGCFRKAVPWITALVMAFMLPLTLYIWLESPVADCGCFGDMIVISNSATFIKNLVLSAFIVVLILLNSRIPSLVRPDFQWIAAAASVAYAFMLAYIGFQYQPLIDFRPYPVGTLLAVENNAADYDTDGEESEVWTFEYEKDGVHAFFAIDSLPDDSWTFIRRIEDEDYHQAKADDRTEGIVLYNEDGDDVTDTAIDAGSDQLLVLIPDASRVGYSRAHLIRSFSKAMDRAGGKMTVIIAGDEDFMWRDHVGHGLEVVLAEDTSIKELARGEIALVYLKSGIVQWKLDATSLPTDYLDNVSTSRAYPLGRLSINSDKWLWSLTVLYVCTLIVLITLPWLMIQIFIAKKRKNA